MFFERTLIINVTYPMNTKDLKKQFKLRDRVIRVLSKDGNIRASVIKNSNSAIEAQNRHNLDFISATLLARLMTGATLYSSFLKGEERVIMEMEGNGPISKLYAEALSVGEVRAYVELRDQINSENFSGFRDAIGVGLLKVSKILYNKNTPIEGIVPIEKGDVATDLAYYFTQSEQIPTAVLFDEVISDDGKIIHSGGIIVQALPGADENDLVEISQKLKNECNLKELLKQEYLPEEILNIILPFDFDTVKNTQTDFYCRCSKDHFKEKLITLGHIELEDMKEKGHKELVCKYCNEHYLLEDSDFDEIISTSKASVN